MFALDNLDILGTKYISGHGSKPFSMETVHIFMRLLPHSAGLLTMKLTALNPTTIFSSHYYIKRCRLTIQLLLIKYTFINPRFGTKLPGERGRMCDSHFDSVTCDRGSRILEFSPMSVASNFSGL